MVGPKNKTYEIKLKGRLNESWAGWFDGLTFSHESDGTTTPMGEVVDQSALHRILKKIRDLGLPLLRLIKSNLTNFKTTPVLN